MRHLYIDNLRVTEHILRCLLHCIVPFMIIANPMWPIHSAHQGTYVADTICFVIHCQTMEVFFAINGFFAVFLLGKLSLKQFIINRLYRIGLPLLLGIVVLSPLLVGLGISWQKNVAFTHIFPHIIAHLSHHPPPLAHLWSLWYLLIIYGVFSWIFHIVSIEKIRIFLQKISALQACVFTVVLSALCLFFYAKKFTAPPESGGFLEWQMVGYFGVYFMLGVWFYIHHQRLHNLHPPKYLWIILMMALGINIYYQTIDNQHITLKILGSLAYCTQVICSAIYIIKLMQRIVFKPKLIQKIATSAYFIYWIELPLVLLFHYLFIDKMPALLLIIYTILFVFFMGYKLFYAFFEHSIWGSASTRKPKN